MRKISRNSHIKKQNNKFMSLKKKLSGENDKICGNQIPICLGLFIAEKEKGRLRFKNRVTKVQNLHACFVSGGG